MNNIELKLNEAGRGAFVIHEEEEKVAEMAFGLSGDHMTIYHTEVAEKLEGKGVAKELLTQAVTYAREHGKKIVPLCQYVAAQFKRHPADYADVWEKA